MKRFTQAKKYLTFAALSAFSASPAFANEVSSNNPMDQIFGAIDLTGIATLVTASGVLIMGITMAFKSITLGKRTVNKA